MDKDQWQGADPNLLAHLSVQVRRVAGHGRWAWSVIDARDGTVLESQFPYESAMAARRAGLVRLNELAPSLPGAKSAGRIADHRADDHLIIVSRQEEALFEVLNRLFADSEGIAVIRDRRRAAPLQQRHPDRRSTRSGPNTVAEARGWWLVCPADARPASRSRESA